MRGDDHDNSDNDEDKDEDENNAVDYKKLAKAMAW